MYNSGNGAALSVCCLSSALTKCGCRYGLVVDQLFFTSDNGVFFEIFILLLHDVHTQHLSSMLCLGVCALGCVCV